MLRFIVVALLASVVSLAGCAQSTSQQYAAASDAFSLTTNTVVDAYNAGVIDRTDLEDYQRIAIPVDALLDRIGAALIAGEDVPESWLDRLDALLAQLELIAGEAQ